MVTSRADNTEGARHLLRLGASRELVETGAMAVGDRIRNVGANDRWLVVVAHPDDESFGCGSLIAHAAGRGAEVTVVCATRGEAGTPAYELDPTESLAAVREAELRAAAAILGAARVDVLDYRDSDFDGPLPDGCLCAAAEEELVDVMAHYLVEVQPNVLLVLDGSDGHRDHIRSRDVAYAAARRIGSDAEVWEHCIPNAVMRQWLTEMQSVKPGTAYHALDPATLGRPDADIMLSIDTTHVLDRREAAIAAHRSQTSPFEGLSPELRRAFLTADHLAQLT